MSNLPQDVAPADDAVRDFYVVGGTMRHDAPSYVERLADKELFDSLTRGRFCYVLTARQMGKSSLMIQTAVRLREKQFHVAVLDLTAIGQNLTVEQWYCGLLVRLASTLGLEDELLEFWSSPSPLGPVQRWVQAIRLVILPHCRERLVIFIDEIDAVRSLPFSTDEFFAGIRHCYNLRSEDAEMNRLTFCLLGVATPADLIQDPRTTPFNIGRRIELHDFTEAEALPLARGLGREESRSRSLLKQILYWTNGHPYLTQQLCQSIAEDRSVADSAGINRLCDEMFIAPRAQQRDNNLLFVRERLLRSGSDISNLLELYGKVLKRGIVRDDETDPLVSVLRLSGVTQSAAGRIKVRNRIYERVFDEAWIRTNTPDAELRRQRAAYRRGLIRAMLVSALILLVVASLAFVAYKQRIRAEQQADANHRLLYFAQMRIVQQEWENANLDQVEELLNAHLPQPGQEDLRSFEWYMFRHLAQSELFGWKEKHQIVSLAFQPDNQTLLFSQALRPDDDGSHKYLFDFYDLKQRQVRSSFKVPAGKNFDLVVFSPDKQRIATDGPDNTINVWESSSGQGIAHFAGYSKAITALAFSPDGQRLVAGDLSGAMKILEVSTGKEILSLPTMQGWIRWAAFSPDGRWIATTDDSPEVKMWDSINGSRQQPFIFAEAVLTRCAFSPDGKMLVSTAKDGRLQFWEVSSRRMAKQASGHTNESMAFAFSPNLQTLATGNADRTVRLWEISTGRELSIIRGHGSAVHDVAWSADGKLLAAGGFDGTVKLWDVATKPEPILPGEPIKQYFATTFSANRQLIALGVTRQGKVKLWNLSAGQALADLDEKEDSILCASFSPDGKWLATGGLDQLVKLWDVASGKLIHSLKSHTAHIYNVEFSPDSRLLISGCEDLKLKLWDVARGLELAHFDSGVKNYFRAVFSPDGKTLAAACSNGGVQLWDIKTVKVLKTFTGHQDRVRAITFSRDGRQLATGGKDNTVRLWDISTGQELKRLGRSDYVQRMTFSWDNKRLVTGGIDGAVRVWDVTTGQELMKLKGHADKVTSVTFSSSDQDLATSGADGTVWLWRAARLQPQR